MKKHRFLLVIFTSCLVNQLTLQGWAGDVMNVEFLQQRAKQSDPEIQTLTQRLNALLQPKKSISVSGLFEFSMITTGITAFTTSYYAKYANTAKALGTVGGATFYAPVLFFFIKDIKVRRDTNRLVKSLEEKNKQMEVKVQALYEGLKQGSSEARQVLVQLTDAESVNEVETNIDMERAWKSYHHHVKFSEPLPETIPTPVLP